MNLKKEAKKAYSNIKWCALLPYWVRKKDAYKLKNIGMVRLFYCQKLKTYQQIKLKEWSMIL